MLVLFLTGLCMAGALTVGLVLVMDNRDGKGIKGQWEEQQRKTSGEPPPTKPSTPAAVHPLSERRIADESRKLIEEIEHFLADPRSS
jgi:hypothetical protein